MAHTWHHLNLNAFFLQEIHLFTTTPKHLQCVCETEQTLRFFDWMRHEEEITSFASVKCTYQWIPSLQS